METRRSTTRGQRNRGHAGGNYLHRQNGSRPDAAAGTPVSSRSSHPASPPESGQAHIGPVKPAATLQPGRPPSPLIPCRRTITSTCRTKTTQGRPGRPDPDGPKRAQIWADGQSQICPAVARRAAMRCASPHHARRRAVTTQPQLTHRLPVSTAAGREGPRLASVERVKEVCTATPHV